MRAWIWNRLRCWFGYHEPLECGGHRSQLAHQLNDGECPNLYCPRCGETVVTRRIEVTSPLPEARLLLDRSGWARWRGFGP